MESLSVAVEIITFFIETDLYDSGNRLWPAGSHHQKCKGRSLYFPRWQREKIAVILGVLEMSSQAARAVGAKTVQAERHELAQMAEVQPVFYKSLEPGATPQVVNHIRNARYRRKSSRRR